MTGGARGVGPGVARLLLSTAHHVTVLGKELRTAHSERRGVLCQERLIGYNFKPLYRNDVEAIFRTAL
jgi:NAD(P)-dependent dehydrogenase (short-subunit alcohol dehydrogenase family)